MDSLRLDKWLWFARFCRTRELAAEMAAAGRIRVNGAATEKAHYAVRPGDVLTLPQGGRVRVVRILALADRRGPASAAQALYEDVPPAA